MNAVATILLIPTLLLVLGAIVSYQQNLRAERTARRDAQRQLASALLAELGAVRSRVRRRLALIELAKQRLGGPSEVEQIPRTWDMTLCPIYAANASNVGQLPQPLPQLIVEFYATVLSLGDEFSFIGSEEWSALPDGVRMKILQRVSGELLTCLRRGTFAIEAVSLLQTLKPGRLATFARGGTR